MLYILSVNAGSSSLKYQLIDMDTETMIAKGTVDRIGIEGGNIKQEFGEKVYRKEQFCSDHNDAMALVIEALLDKEYGALTDINDIYAVGHRVLHGGSAFTASSLINDEVMDAIRDNIDLGPLHNPANIMGIEACQKIMPDKPQVAVFDTAFHQTMPPKAYMYSLPYEYYTKYKVRRYGFHGTSHLYLTGETARFLGFDLEGSRIITCHLGNGSSVAAIKDGKVIDTSMGITPLEGLTMGTRSGDMDPAIIEFMCKKLGTDVGTFTNILNKESGLKGISGLTNDMRDIMKGMDEGNERARLAYEIFIYKVAKYIGAYAVALGGVDYIVFSAGIGENTPRVRKDILDYVEFLGVKVDDEKNNRRGGSYVISTDDSRIVACVIPTNEELVIARDTLRLANEALGR